ncbi:MAG TPA: pyridoxal-phosphate dependent enzyme [Bacteroidia bacterium]|nr:pyridoxal-phosphate dependent enzyme [Bacteroidia bacterium]
MSKTTDLLEFEPHGIDTLIQNSGYRVDILRLDRMHPLVSGNKWYKLKYNLQELKSSGKKTLITFGGAYSNHIAATAATCHAFGIPVQAFIRGEDQADNPTLAKARESGMKLHFLSRAEYAKKDDPGYIEALHKRFSDAYIVPEGGSNQLGIKGCTDILKDVPVYDYVFCACGTGSTFAGLLRSEKIARALIGVSVLKGENTLPMDITENLMRMDPGHRYNILGNEILDGPVITEHGITNRYAFSGYAGFDKSLLKFKLNFEKQFGIVLDHVYTVKMAYAAFDLLQTGRLQKQSSVLLIHSGGLQGNIGFEKRYQDKLIL